MADTQVKLPDTSKLIVSSSPHFHKPHNASKVMWTVVAALLPACGVGVAVFGWRALWVLALTTVACVACEAVFCKLRGRRVPLADGSAIVTGILLGMNFSSATPWWVCVIGAVLAIGLAKQLYGGLGYNIFNPVLVARVGLLIALPTIMTTWPVPNPDWWSERVPDAIKYSAEATTAATSETIHHGADAVSTATPLGMVEDQTVMNQSGDYIQFALGNMPGCIGETSAIALLLGGLLLVWRGYIRWQVPVSFIGTVAVITAVAHAAAPGTYAPMPFHLLTGGLFLGAIFMATDMVTSPMSKKGAVVFGIGCGVITGVIRLWGNLPEGVSFSILFMNALVPLIDRYTANKPFGLRKEKTA